MLWMIMIFLILQAQGGIFRQQLFDLQDAALRPPTAEVQARQVDANAKPSRPKGR